MGGGQDATGKDPRAAFAGALGELRRQRADWSDETLARRASRTVLPSGRLVTVNARRLGEWISGRSVPRDFDGVLALVLAIQPTVAFEPWRRLWRAAFEHQTAARRADRVEPAVSQDLVVGRPPTDAAGLRDRKPLAEAIDAALNTDGTRQVILSGTGGVGKTQLASAAFHRARGAGAVLVWTAASSPESVHTTYARAWRALAGADPAHPNVPSDDDVQADLFIAWLRTTQRPWLVVLDDVDDPAALDGLWPIGPHGRCLVTTRRRDAALVGPSTITIDVGMFTRQEACDYLRARLSAVDGVDELADSLGCYPLALSQAAAFIIDTGISVYAYRGLLADRRETVSDLFPPTSPADGHQGTVGGTWRLALERAAALVPAGHARAVLDLLALLASDGVPEAVLLTGAACRRVGGADGPVSTRAALLALRALHRLSLITHDPTRRPASIAVHPLVQRATRDTATSPAAVAADAAAAIEEVWSADPDPETVTALFRCVNVLDATAGEHLWADGMHPVLRRPGQHLMETGRAAAARQSDEALLHTARDRLGDGHRDVLFLHARMAAATGELGNAAAAYGVLTGLASRAIAALDPDDRDGPVIRSYAARWRLETGAVVEASADYQVLIPELERLLGRFAPQTVDARRWAALCVGLSGNPVAARDASAALAVALEGEYRPDDPRILPVLADQGRWTGEAGDADGAVTLHQRAVDGLNAAVGPMRVETVIARHNLGCWHGLAGQFAAAVATLTVAAADAARALGPAHPTTLSARANLAYWRGWAGEPVQGVAELDRIVVDIEQNMGCDHPRALRVHQQRAELRELAGDRAGAVCDLQLLLVRMTEVHGADNPRTREVAELLTGWT